MAAAYPDQISGPPGQLMTTAWMTGLGGAHATVHIRGDSAVIAFGTVDHQVQLIDPPHVVRRLLTDALAQLDAAEAVR